MKQKLLAVKVVTKNVKHVREHVRATDCSSEVHHEMLNERDHFL